MIHDIVVAFAFLTRIPIRHRDGVFLHHSARWFPLVGAVVGGLGGGTFWLASQWVPSTVAAVLALLITVLVTGGFHQDGLADVFDGLVGGWTPEDRLRILKDSRHGTYGVLALVLQSLLQVSCLATLSPRDGALALVAAHTLARLAPVALMFSPAAPGQAGMGTAYAREIRPRDLAVAVAVTAAVLLPLLQLRALALAGVVAVPVLALLLWVRRRIGGVVGDALGAAEQVAESAVLLAFVVAAGGIHA